MSDVMNFPDTVEEFMEQYKITDTEQIYTNGTKLVPIFRMKQWFEHLPSEEPERKTGQWIIDNEGMLHCSECAKIPVNRIRDTFKVVYDIHPLKMNYCPNCGVRMVGEQSET